MIRIVESGVASKKAFLERAASFARPLVRNQYYAEPAHFGSSGLRGLIYVSKGRIQLKGGGLAVEASRGDVIEQQIDGAVEYRIVEVPCTLVRLWQLELLVADGQVQSAPGQTSAGSGD